MYYKNHNMLNEQDWWASVKSQMQLPTQKVNEINEPTSHDDHDQIPQDTESNFEKLKLGAAKVKYRAFIDAMKDMSNQNAMILLKSFMEEFMIHSKIQPQMVKKIVNSAIGREEVHQVDFRNAQNKLAMEQE
jgi:hypothetical protein